MPQTEFGCSNPAISEKAFSSSKINYLNYIAVAGPEGPTPMMAMRFFATRHGFYNATYPVTKFHLVNQYSTCME